MPLTLFTKNLQEIHQSNGAACEWGLETATEDPRIIFDIWLYSVSDTRRRNTNCLPWIYQDLQCDAAKSLASNIIRVVDYYAGGPSFVVQNGRIGVHISNIMKCNYASGKTFQRVRLTSISTQPGVTNAFYSEDLGCVSRQEDGFSPSHYDTQASQMHAHQNQSLAQDLTSSMYSQQMDHIDHTGFTSLPHSTFTQAVQVPISDTFQDGRLQRPMVYPQMSHSPSDYASLRSASYILPPPLPSPLEPRTPESQSVAQHPTAAMHSRQMNSAGSTSSLRSMFTRANPMPIQNPLRDDCSQSSAVYPQMSQLASEYVLPQTVSYILPPPLLSQSGQGSCAISVPQCRAEEEGPITLAPIQGLSNSEPQVSTHQFSQSYGTFSNVVHFIKGG